MIPGFATPEGSERFKKRFVAGKHSRAPLHSDHFRPADGLWLSSIGAGTYLGEPDEATDRIYEAGLKEAIRSGVNVLDSAINYRNQRSERNIGRAVRELIEAQEVCRDELFLCTKGGFPPFDPETPPDAGTQGFPRMSPAFLEDQLRRSLENFGVETLDLYYLHNPEIELGAVDRKEFSRRLEKAFQFLEKKVAEGKIRRYGVATWEGFRNAPDQADHLSLEEINILARGVAGRGHHFKAVQLPLNLAMPEAWIFRNQNYGANFLSLLEVAQKLGFLVFASASLLQGRLAHVGDSPLTALQFTRSCPGLVTALVGMKQPAHVRQNLEIAKIPPLTGEEMRNTFLKPVQNQEEK